MVNRVVLVGRLTRDPELKRTAQDTPVAQFTLAIDDRARDQQGNKTTSFINVVAWNNQAENAAKYCRKGSLVGVDGRIRQRSYVKNDGSKASVFEVIADSVQFLEPKGERTVENEEVTFDDEPVDTTAKNLESTDVTDDDLPF